MVTHLVLVTDASLKGRNVAATIDKVARKGSAEKKTDKNIGLVFNRIKNEKEAAELLPLTDLKILGWIPESEKIREFDRSNKSFFHLPEDPALSSLRRIVQHLTSK